MWNVRVPGIGENFYNFTLWFLVYSVMGWVVETIYISYCNKKFINRGFIHGPICPIYGFGGIFVHTALKSFAGHYVTIFILGSCLATCVEFMTAKIMIKVFGCLWWDYSNKPFNYKGILCLESCVAWGLYSVADAAFIKNVVFMGIMKIPFKIGKAIVLVAFIYYTIDFTISAYMSTKGKVESEDNNILQFKV